MQHQYQDNKILKHEDELTDISLMPKAQLDAIAAKPAYTQTNAPASTSTTMQSFNEVPKEGEENILGSVASIHDQMQPGSFMSPISDRKSGSIENVITEDKATSTEPGFFKEGVEAVKEAVHISKEERSEIKDAIVTEAKALGEAATYFADVAAEKIEGFYSVAAQKVGELVHTLEKKALEIQHDLGLDSAAGKEMRGVQPSTADLKISEMKNSMTKKAYMMRKSLRRKLGKKGERKLEIIEKKAAMAAGFAKVFAREEAKDLKRRAKRFTRNFQKDAKDDKGILKAKFNEKGVMLDRKVRQVQDEAIKDAGLAKEAIKQGASTFQEKAQAFGNEFMNESGKAINMIKKEGREFQGKAMAFFNEFRRENRLAMSSIKQGGKDLLGQARQYEREFKDDFMVPDYLRAKARYYRSGARRVMNEISKSAYIRERGQAKSQDFSSSSESKSFLLDISAHDWNGNTLDSSRFSDNSESSKFLLEIPASEWNHTSAEYARQRASYLSSRAQGWMERASEEFSLLLKGFRTQAGEFKKGANNLKSDAAFSGNIIMEGASDAADKAKKYMIEKKSDLQFQAELLTQDRFPSQEALAKKQAINSEIRNFHKGN